MSLDRFPFQAHLKELRSRLITSFVALGASFAVCCFASEHLVAVLFRPIRQALPPGSTMVFTALTEGFFAYLRVAFWSALIISTPVLLHQVWSFIAPGLYTKEKRFLRGIIFWGALLFAAGGLFGYLVVMPVVLSITLGFVSEGLEALPRLQLYLLFVLKTILTFGLIFEVPFLMAAAGRAGLVSADYFRKNRKISYIALYILAVLMVPTDFFSQILLFLPLACVYEVGVGLAGWLGR